MEADVAPFVWWKGPEQRVLQQDDPLFQVSGFATHDFT